MYDPVYGNHIGVVIDNQDPENRGRLQIFIPHLSNNLLPTWNTNLQDISFKSTEVDAKLGSVLERLKNTLPWAETAVPSFGGGTAGPTKYDGNSSPLPLVPNAAGMLINAKKVDSLNLSKNGNVKTADSNSYKVPSSQIKLDVNGLTSNLYEKSGRGGADLKTSITFPDATQLSDGSRSFDATKVMYVAVPTNSNLAGKPIALQYTDDKGITTYATAYGLDNGAASQNQAIEISPATAAALNIPVKIVDGQLVTAVGSGGSLSSSLITDGSMPTFNVKNGYMYDDNGKVVTLSDYQSLITDKQLSQEAKDKLASATISKSSPVQMTDSLAAEGGVGSPSGGGAAAGFFSKPAIGAKVWVFFHGGDVQRPVYFASVMEPVNYQVANQTVASS